MIIELGSNPSHSNNNVHVFNHNLQLNILEPYSVDFKIFRGLNSALLPNTSLIRHINIRDFCFWYKRSKRYTNKYFYIELYGLKTHIIIMITPQNDHHHYYYSITTNYVMLYR